MKWVKNTSGKEDATLSMLIVAFIFALLLGIVGAVESLSFGDINIAFRSFDVGWGATVLSPLLLTYFGRRKTDKDAELKEKEMKLKTSLPEQPE